MLLCSCFVCVRACLCRVPSLPALGCDPCRPCAWFRAQAAENEDTGTRGALQAQTGQKGSFHIGVFKPD